MEWRRKHDSPLPQLLERVRIRGMRAAAVFVVDDEQLFEAAVEEGVEGGNFAAVLLA